MTFTSKGRINFRVNYDSVKKLLTGQIRDTRTCLNKDDLPRLFSRSGKLNRSVDVNHDGIGLGLTMVKEIIKKSGGTVSTTSNGKGHGTILIFHMQMEKVPEQDANLIQYQAQSSSSCL